MFEIISSTFDTFGKMKKIKLSREQNIPEIHHTKFKKGEKKKIHNIAEKKRKEKKAISVTDKSLT